MPRDVREIVFVRGATEAINLVANTWGPAFLKAGDEVMISELEHHSNIVPWQMLRERLGIKLVVAPIDADRRPRHGRVRAAARHRAPSWSAMTHIANAIGTLAAGRDRSFASPTKRAPRC